MRDGTSENQVETPALDSSGSVARAERRTSKADAGAAPARDEGGTPALPGRFLVPADKVAAGYLIVLSLLILANRERIGLWVQFVAAHTIVVALIALIARWDRVTDPAEAGADPLRHAPSRLARFIHGWYPVALIPLTFKELGYLIPRIHLHDFDSALAAIDYGVFGAHPTVWLERLTWPPLTELLQLCYPTYYFLPIILGAVVWRSRNAERFRFWVFVVTLAFYLSYLGYIVVPAIGPRFLPEILDAQTKPLTGLLFFQTVRDTLDRGEGLTRDCFPSGHTEITLLTLYYARRFHRKTYRFLLPLGAAIILSTVYLRYHYVVDVVAGVLLAGAVILSARKVFCLLGGDDRVALDV